MIQVGKKYRHYKGTIYRAMFTGKNSETMEDVIIYQNVEDYSFWVRPLNMWNEVVDENGTQRFTLLEEQDD